MSVLNFSRSSSTGTARRRGNSSSPIDRVGAGIGERVLITRGSGARLALDDRETPTDAVIVGIIDE